jgi:uncharacterized protein
MSDEIFVDTSAWYAVADETDARHREAAAILRRLAGGGYRLVTTNYVASESYTLLRVRLGFRVAGAFLARLRTSASARRVFVTEAWEEAAEELLNRYADHEFSYVDATSFIAMNRLGLSEAFAFDRHFAIAGFRVLDS